MMVMGWTLWKSELDFEDIAEDYFNAAFGPDGPGCYNYLKRLSELFDPVYLRGEKPEVDPERARAFSEVLRVIEEFKPVIERNINLPDKCQATSWRYLKHHADIYGALAAALEARARGDRDEAHRRWETVKDLAWEREDVLHPVFDVWLFVKTVGRKFRD